MIRSTQRKVHMPNMNSWLYLCCGTMLACSQEDKAWDTCFSSCYHQQEFCAGIDLPACLDLCEYVIALHTDNRSCLQRDIEMWQCDQTIDWTCSSETNVVGDPRDDQCIELREDSCYTK